MKKKNQVMALIILALAGIGIIFASGVLLKKMLSLSLAGYVLKAGTPMQFGAYTVLIDKVKGNKLYGIKVSSKGKRFKAESGQYQYLPEKNAIKFSLVNGTADDYDPENPRQYHTLTFKQSTFTVPLKPAK